MTQRKFKLGSREAILDTRPATAGPEWPFSPVPPPAPPPPRPERSSLEEMVERVAYLRLIGVSWLGPGR